MTCLRARWRRTCASVGVEPGSTAPAIRGDVDGASWEPESLPRGSALRAAIARWPVLGSRSAACPGSHAPGSRRRGAGRRVADCRRCPRLVAWREEVAPHQAGGLRRRGVLGSWGSRVRRSGGADRGGGPGPGRPRRQPHRAHVHRRPFGRVAVPGAVAGRAGQPAGEHVARRRSRAARHLDHVAGEVRPAGQQAHAGRARHLRPVPARGAGPAGRRPGRGRPRASSGSTPSAPTSGCDRGRRSVTASRSRYRPTRSARSPGVAR